MLVTSFFGSCERRSRAAPWKTDGFSQLQLTHHRAQLSSSTKLVVLLIMYLRNGKTLHGTKK